jgi:hypothetical protein
MEALSMNRTWDSGYQAYLPRRPSPRSSAFSGSTPPPNGLLKNPFFPRLLKKAQVQGGARRAE